MTPEFVTVQLDNQRQATAVITRTNERDDATVVDLYVFPSDATDYAPRVLQDVALVGGDDQGPDDTPVYCWKGDASNQDRSGAHLDEGDHAEDPPAGADPKKATPKKAAPVKAAAGGR